MNFPFGHRSRHAPSFAMWPCALAASVVLHAAGVWALTQIHSHGTVEHGALVVEVSIVAPQSSPGPQIDVPVPEDTPPRAELESMVEPPPPDLPPPVLSEHAPSPPATKPKDRVAPPSAQPHRPTEAPQSLPAAVSVVPAIPKVVGVSQVRFLVPPAPTYPPRARRNSEQGEATVRVLVDVDGRPQEVSLQTSSGHLALDQSAVAAIRATRFRPYAEDGVPQPVFVLVPINFVLQ